MNSRIRVLVVDDSAFARKVIREVLSEAPDIEVVGVARDGLEALEKVQELAPDVITLDLMMPILDGIGLLQALPRDRPPRVIIVSTSEVQSDLGIAALEAGAVDVVHKPTALASEQLYSLGAELRRKVKVAAGARPRPAAAAAPPPVALVRQPQRRVLVIGTSTGGPQALTRVLPALPLGFPLPVLVALHIPAGYTEALAQRLDDTCALEVLEADTDMELLPGRVIIARGGWHLRVARASGAVRAKLDVEPLDAPHCPSVDVLFESASECFGSGVLAVVMTGMGNDGTRGAGAVRAAGGYVLTEAESTCVVYGMPRAVKEAGLSNAELPLEQLPRAIVEHA